MQLELAADSELSAEKRAELVAWFDRMFGDAPHAWRHGDWYVLASTPTDGHVGRVGILKQEILVGETKLVVGGIGGVITENAFRRRGIARLMMQRAAEFMHDDLQVDFGLLLCADDVLPLYEGLGWKLVDGPTWCHEPSGRVEYEELTMVLPCQRQDWPAGEIDLCSAPW